MICCRTPTYFQLLTLPYLIRISKSGSSYLRLFPRVRERPLVTMRLNTLLGLALPALAMAQVCIIRPGLFHSFRTNRYTDRHLQIPQLLLHHPPHPTTKPSAKRKPLATPTSALSVSTDAKVQPTSTSAIGAPSSPSTAYRPSVKLTVDTIASRLLSMMSAQVLRTQERRRSVDTSEVRLNALTYRTLECYVHHGSGPEKQLCTLRQCHLSHTRV